MAASIVIVILVFLVFGSSSIIESFLKMRRMKKGEDIIKEPWQEIHDIPGYHDARIVAAFYPLKGEPNIMPILEELAIEGRLLLLSPFPHRNHKVTITRQVCEALNGLAWEISGGR